MTICLQRALTVLALSFTALSAMANEPAMAVQRPLNLTLPSYSGMASQSNPGPWLDTTQRSASPTHSPLPYGSGFENRPNRPASRQSEASGHSPKQGGSGQGRGQRRGR
jgi:hypothetical protein